jgi:hypothetical protein
MLYSTIIFTHTYEYNSIPSFIINAHNNSMEALSPPYYEHKTMKMALELDLRVSTNDFARELNLRTVSELKLQFFAIP